MFSDVSRAGIRLAPKSVVEHLRCLKRDQTELPIIGTERDHNQFTESQSFYRFMNVLKQEDYNSGNKALIV